MSLDRHVLLHPWFGWPRDAEFERVRAEWVREPDAAKAPALAENIERRGTEVSMSIPFGQLILPAAWRDNLEGLLSVPETLVFWNVANR